MQPKDLETLARNVRRLMSDRQWTQEQLADRAKVSQKTVSHLLALKNSPTVETLSGLAKAFGVSTWTLLMPQDGVSTLNERNMQLSKAVEALRSASDKDREALMSLLEKFR